MQFLDYLPSELIIEIFYYLDDYESMINMYNLLYSVVLSAKDGQNDPRKKSFNPQTIKTILLQKINNTDIVNMIDLPTTNNINLLLAVHARIIRTYTQSKERLDYMINDINNKIKKYYPGFTMDNYENIFDSDLLDLRIDNELSRHFYTIRIVTLPEKLLSVISRSLISMGSDYTYNYNDFINSYSMGSIINMHIQIYRLGMNIWFEDFEISAPLSYQDMLTIIFYLNYNNYLRYIEDNIKNNV